MYGDIRAYMYALCILHGRLRQGEARRAETRITVEDVAPDLGNLRDAMGEAIAQERLTEAQHITGAATR